MKKLVLLLFLVPGFCSAQQNGNIPKPAADDCPSWNKKSKSSSKAEYFYYLRTNKAKDQQIPSDYPTTSQRSYPSKTIVRYTPEEDPFLIPKRARRAQQTNSPVRNTAVYAGSNMNAVGRIMEKEKAQETPAINVPIKEETPVVPVEKIEKKEEKAVEIKEESSVAGEKTPSKHKIKKERRVKLKSKRSSTPKVKACKSGNASKCPSF